MKKLLVIVLICTLAALMLAACGDNSNNSGGTKTASSPDDKPAGTTASTEAPDSGNTGSGMTESYAAGRQAYYDLTGIWMPEAVGFEAEHEANFEHKSIAFDSHGDRALYEAAKAALVQALGEPDSGDENGAYWARHNADETAVLNYEVYYHEGETDGVWVFMNYYEQPIEG